MNTKILFCLSLLLATGTVQARENLVLPDRYGGHTARGATIETLSHTVATPEVQSYTEYHSDDGLLTSSRVEVPVSIPQFDASLGELIAINLTYVASLQSEITVEANTIIDTDQTHEAVFASLNTIFNDTAGYPAVGLLQRPTDDPRGIAPGFYTLGAIDVNCFGIPADEDACYETNYFEDDADRTVDVFIFEDANGPIYTLSDWLGSGSVPNFTVFVDNPGLGVDEDQWEFYTDNIDSASGYIETYAFSGDIIVEYVYEVDQPDADGDGVFDDLDNCIEQANPTQLDTNGDGYGNACDPDLNNDGIVNTVDLGLFRLAFFATGVTVTDFNGDGVTNFVDLGVMRLLYFGPPGPSGTAP